ncbi:Polysaccharide deacetylase [Clostridium amylolyticum]|uniref:Polysaccharide deacetylase n=1 Tax=Clostridium amylolyticum TaxID=1121298 RepID=A0A1M6IEB3_9CLOT|nr:Polysaccharide deacetylase [Clostridium amylolyticum]
MICLKISNKRFLITIAMGLAAALVLTAAVGEMKLKNAKKSIIQTSDKTSKNQGKEKDSTVSSTKNTKDEGRNINSEKTTESSGIPILTYNSVKEKEGIEGTVSKNNFEIQMKHLKENGYNSITSMQLSEYLINNKSLPEKPVLITFDSGYNDKYTLVLPILKKYGFKAICFIDGSKVNNVTGYLTSSQINEMQDYGMEIGMYYVSSNNIAEMTMEQQKRIISDGKQKLEKVTKKPVSFISYDDKKYNADTINAVKSFGFNLGFTTLQGLANKKDNVFEIKRINIENKDTLESYIKKLKIK